MNYKPKNKFDVLGNFSYNPSEHGEWEEFEGFRNQAQGNFQRKIIKLRALADVFQLADRVLSNSDVSVNLVLDENMPTSAWSDGKSISINAERVEDTSDRNLAGVRGLNYHELSHVMWTPRAGSDFVKTLLDENLWQAFNMLEDSRIETLFTALYPATIPYLTTCTLIHVLEDGAGSEDKDALANAFALTRGRRFLPIQLRQTIADKCIKANGVEYVNKVATIIDEFRLLIFPRDYTRGIELVRDFAQVTKVNSRPSHPFPNNECGERSPMKSGRMAPTKEQEKVLEKALKSDSKYETENLDGGELEPTEQRETVSDNIIDEINKTIKETIGEASVREDVKKLREVLGNGTGNAQKILKQANYQMKTINSVDAVTARQFARELEQLQLDSDPSWQTEVSSGRLNINRAMRFNPTKLGTLFDRWDEGNDRAFDMETAILLDHSGSMVGDIDTACRAMWVLKTAMDTVNANTSVYSFNGHSRVLYEANERTNKSWLRYLPADGYTDPSDALLEVERVMLGSNKTNKMVFIITDGSWNSESLNNGIISRLQDEGVVVVVVYIGARQAWEKPHEFVKHFGHGADIFHVISETRQLIPMAKELLFGLLKRKA